MRHEESDQALIASALRYWANYIETGIMHLSAEDLARSGSDERPRVLTEDQTRTVLRLRDLARSVMASESR